MKWIRQLGAEFTVILLGILVALAIDDYREFRSDRAEERYWLSELIENLEEDIDELEGIIKRAQEKQWALKIIEGVLGEGPLMPPDSIKPLIGCLRNLTRTIDLRLFIKVCLLS